VDAVLTDSPVKIGLGAEVETLAKLVKCNRLFRDSQEKSRKPKQLKKKVRNVDLSEEEYESFVLNVRNLTQCPDLLPSDPSALHVINGPTTVAPDSATSVFLTTAALMMLLII
jgi:hypothetical protein